MALALTVDPDHVDMHALDLKYHQSDVDNADLVHVDLDGQGSVAHSPVEQVFCMSCQDVAHVVYHCCLQCTAGLAIH